MKFLKTISAILCLSLFLSNFSELNYVVKAENKLEDLSCKNILALKDELKCSWGSIKISKFGEEVREFNDEIIGKNKCIEGDDKSDQKIIFGKNENKSLKFWIAGRLDDSGNTLNNQDDLSKSKEAVLYQAESNIKSPFLDVTNFSKQFEKICSFTSDELNLIKKSKIETRVDSKSSKLIEDKFYLPIGSAFSKLEDGNLVSWGNDFKMSHLIPNKYWASSFDDFEISWLRLFNERDSSITTNGKYGVLVGEDREEDHLIAPCCKINLDSILFASSASSNLSRENEFCSDIPDGMYLKTEDKEHANFKVKSLQKDSVDNVTLTYDNGVKDSDVIICALPKKDKKVRPLIAKVKIKANGKGEEKLSRVRNLNPEDYDVVSWMETSEKSRVNKATTPEITKMVFVEKKRPEEDLSELKKEWEASQKAIEASSKAQPVKTDMFKIKSLAMKNELFSSWGTPKVEKYTEKDAVDGKWSPSKRKFLLGKNKCLPGSDASNQKILFGRSGGKPIPFWIAARLDKDGNPLPNSMDFLKAQSDSMVLYQESSVLDMPFSESKSQVWETSDIRNFLNGDFTKMCFGPAELELIKSGIPVGKVKDKFNLPIASGFWLSDDLNFSRSSWPDELNNLLCWGKFDNAHLIPNSYYTDSVYQRLWSMTFSPSDKSSVLCYEDRQKIDQNPANCTGRGVGVVTELDIKDIAFASSASTFLSKDNGFVNAPEGMYLKKLDSEDSGFKISRATFQNKELKINYRSGRKNSYVVLCAIPKDGKGKTLTARAKIPETMDGEVKFVVDDKSVILDNYNISAWMETDNGTGINKATMPQQIVIHNYLYFESLDKYMSKFNRFVGLSSVKETMENFLASILLFQSLYEESGVPRVRPSLHMVFKGNPGTGKTEVARTVAEVLYDSGIIRLPKCVEVTRKDLVAGFVGQTESKTASKIAEAKGGVLFIDEAYSLTNGGDQDFGSKAIEELLSAMTSPDNDVVVIVAGYEDDMNQFLNANAGLERRFTTTLRFPDYTDDQLIQIFANLCRWKNLKFSSESEVLVREHLKKAGPLKSLRNADYMVKLLEKVLLEKDRLFRTEWTRKPTCDEVRDLSFWSIKNTIEAIEADPEFYRKVENAPKVVKKLTANLPAAIGEPLAKCVSGSKRKLSPEEIYDIQMSRAMSADAEQRISELKERIASLESQCVRDQSMISDLSRQIVALNEERKDLEKQKNQIIMALIQKQH